MFKNRGWASGESSTVPNSLSSILTGTSFAGDSPWPLAPSPSLLPTGAAALCLCPALGQGHCPAQSLDVSPPGSVRNPASLPAPLWPLLPLAQVSQTESAMAALMLRLSLAAEPILAFPLPLAKGGPRFLLPAPVTTCQGALSSKCLPSLAARRIPAETLTDLSFLWQ